jgi:hypothetical protein
MTRADNETALAQPRAVGRATDTILHNLRVAAMGLFSLA